MSERLPDWIRNATEQQFGDFGEKLWSGIFATAELSYIPLHKINDGGAPMQKGQDRLILPDFDVSSPTFSVYVDSKAKRHPITYRVANELRHGVSKRAWQHYEAISAQHRKHCCIALFEAFHDINNADWSGALLLQTLVRLGKPFDGFKTMADTVFWPRHRFATIGSVTPEQAINICNRHREPPSFKDPIWELLELRVQAPVQRSLY